MAGADDGKWRVKGLSAESRDEIRPNLFSHPISLLLSFMVNAFARPVCGAINSKSLYFCCFQIIDSGQPHSETQWSCRYAMVEHDTG